MYLQAETTTFAEVSGDGGTGGQTFDSENVTFIDNASGVAVSAAPALNHVASVDNTDDLTLGNFLSRPTLIDTSTWTTSDATGTGFNYKPWARFLENPAIKRKIDNFAYLRGRLHIKVVLNGTPFQFGAMRVAYSPLLGAVADKVRLPPVDIRPILIPYSQQPGFFIQPQANAGGYMTLPFFYHENWLDITNFADVANFGTLTYIIYAPLRLAVAGGSTSVTIQTFAWMTDVELMGSTNRLALQADEYIEGPISGPATSLASYASMLTHIPYIAPFARATTIGATAVAAIARLFGYTNTPVIADVHAFMPMNAPMLASGHIGTAVQKLTLDPKQELSIDPSPHGLEPRDELCMTYLKTKESYIGEADWQVTDIYDSLLFCMRVNPNQATWVDVPNLLGTTVGKRVYHTPVSYIGGIFKQWRGGLVLRIKIVATKFHKGRLKIQYDPRSDIGTLPADENVVYTTILDIGEQDDIEIEIPYHQPRAWLENDQSFGITPNNDTFPLAPRAGIDNGLLTIRVLTALTAPSNAVVSMMMFVKGADDFEYANPAEKIGPDVSNRIPSFFALQAEDHVEIVPTRICIGKKAVVSGERYGLNYGENICSLRALLHRSQIMDTAWLETGTALSIASHVKILKIMPYTPGRQASATWPIRANNAIAAGNSPYSFTTMHLMPYVAGMFLGYRGGANYTLTPSTDTYGSVGDFRVVRWTTAITNAAYRYIFNQGNRTLTGSQSARSAFLNLGQFIQDGLGGMAINSTQTNGSLVVQIPDYKPFNFSLADPNNYMFGSSRDGTDIQNVAATLLIKNTTTSESSYNTLQTEVAAAPDFTCLFFLCCPTLDYSQGAPSAIT